MPPITRDTPKILLTGDTGFVGTYLRAALVARWPQADVIGLSPNATGSSGRGDLLDRVATDAAVATIRPDIIIHLAGQPSVARGAVDEGMTWAVNLGGTLNLALAVASHAPDAIVLFASSSEVYGESFRDGSVDEASPLRPATVYARSKVLAEHVLAEVLPATTQLIVARPFNHTGPGQREDFVLPSFVGQVARIEAGLQDKRLNVGNIDVSRDFLDVRDVVAAYIALVSAARPMPKRFTCNISSDAVQPLRQHLETLRRLARCDFEIVVDPARLRPADLPAAAGRSQLLRDVTGWSPRHEISKTIDEMLAAARRALV